MNPLYATLIVTSISFSLQSISSHAAEFDTQSLPPQLESVQNIGSHTLLPQNLLQIYQQAQANDPAWAAAQKANQAAQEKIIQGRALMLPTVGLSANANHADTDIQYTGSANVFRNSGSEHFET